MGALLELNRSRVLAFRRRTGALDERLPAGQRSLRQAGWAGMQDSMPRAAQLSIHARVAAVPATAWEHASLAQVWGPRFNVFVVAKRDLALFTLGTWPHHAKGQHRAHALADRLEALLGTGRMAYDEAGSALGVDPNALRYAAATGRVLIRWEGARCPTVWTVPPPDVDPVDARRELARRYLHVYGPATSTAFSRWAGISGPGGAAAFARLAPELVPVRTPAGDAWILASDEDTARRRPGKAAPARLLPGGDAYFLLYGADRALLVPDGRRRGELWTSRVWPGALLVRGEIAGTWRRSGRAVTVSPWRALSSAEREAVVAEAESLPLPGLQGTVTLRFQG